MTNQLEKNAMRMSERCNILISSYRSYASSDGKNALHLVEKAPLHPSGEFTYNRKDTLQCPECSAKANDTLMTI